MKKVLHRIFWLIVFIMFLVLGFFPYMLLFGSEEADKVTHLIFNELQ